LLTAIFSGAFERGQKQQNSSLLSMVSAEGMPSASDINALGCQTILTARIDPQRVFPAVSNLPPIPQKKTRDEGGDLRAGNSCIPSTTPTPATGD
jgi:hypothetical protein